MNIRERKAAAAAERWSKIKEEFNEMKQKEHEKLRKKDSSISELQNVLSELSNKRDFIKSCIVLKKNELIEEFNKRTD